MNGSQEGRRKRRTARSRDQRADDNSARRQSVLALARLAAKQARAAAPKCGARRRDGEPCQNLPVVGRTRCTRHGGKTPAGAGWHVVQLPADPVRRARKLRDIARRRQRQAERVAAMSEADRQKFERHSRAMQPGGGKTRREAARRNREALAMFVAAEARPPAQCPEADALAAEIERLRRRLTELQPSAPIVETADTTTTTSNERHDL